MSTNESSSINDNEQIVKNNEIAISMIESGSLVSNINESKIYYNML